MCSSDLEANGVRYSAKVRAKTRSDSSMSLRTGANARLDGRNAGIGVVWMGVNVAFIGGTVL